MPNTVRRAACLHRRDVLLGGEVTAAAELIGDHSGAHGLRHRPPSAAPHQVSPTRCALARDGAHARPGRVCCRPTSARTGPAQPRGSARVCGPGGPVASGNPFATAPRRERIAATADPDPGGNRRRDVLPSTWAGRRFMVAVEYDGEHHRSDLRQYRKDIRRMEELVASGLGRDSSRCRRPSGGDTAAGPMCARRAAIECVLRAFECEQ